MVRISHCSWNQHNLFLCQLRWTRQHTNNHTVAFHSLPGTDPIFVWSSSLHEGYRTMNKCLAFLQDPVLNWENIQLYDHLGGNLVHKHKTMKLDMVREQPTKNHSPCVLKLAKRHGVYHLNFQLQFPVFPCKWWAPLVVYKKILFMKFCSQIQRFFHNYS